MREKLSVEINKRWWNIKTRIYYRKINRVKFYGVKKNIIEYRDEILKLYNPYINRLSNVLKEIQNAREADIFSVIFAAMGKLIIPISTIEKLSSLIEDSFTKGSKRVLTRKGEKIKLGEVKNNSTLKALQQEQISYLRGFDSKMREEITNIFLAKLKEGATISDIRNTLVEKVNTLTKTSAERAARSTIIEASNRGTLQTMKEAGIEKYGWLSARDDRVCKLCQKLDKGSPYNVNDRFAPIPVRDTHPNCRCVLIAWV